MGDAVNLASRLEGLTKYYGTPLLVSGEVVTDVPDYLYRLLDRVRVKGRHEAVDIYEPWGLLETAAKEDKESVALFERGVEAYLKQSWNEAEQLFRAYLTIYEEDVMANIYLQRIAEFKETPPAENWQGVYSHTSK